MPNPKGNPGNKGGGRKGAYLERASAELLWEMWEGIKDKDACREKIKKGKYSLKEAFLLRALNGDRQILIEIFKKLFPDKVISEQHGRITFILDE